MKHIHQIGTQGSSYTYIVEVEGDVETHASVVDHPELFEVVDGMPPENAQKLIYSYGRFK